MQRDYILRGESEIGCVLYLHRVSVLSHVPLSTKMKVSLVREIVTSCWWKVRTSGR